MLETLRSDHDELQALLRRAGAIMAGKEAADATALGSLRWTVNRLLSRHLAFLEAFVFPAARKAALPPQIAIVDQLARETRILADAYQRHINRYPAIPESMQQEDYRSSAQLLLRQTERLIELEREKLYPLLPGVDNPLRRAHPR